MSKTKFTEGPWEVFDGSIIGYFIHCRSNVDSDEIKDYSPIVCATWGAEYSELKGEEIHDAYLIASSPELYKAADAAIKLLISLGMQHTDEYRLLVKSTSKARGEVK